MTLQSIMTTVEEIEREKARRKILPFTTMTMEEYEVNWHHKVICDALDRWAFGDSRRLILSAPPRYGKSELVSRRLPAYIFGRNPNARIISASYSSDLAQRNNRDVQRIMDTEKYKLIFPDTKLAYKRSKEIRNTDMFEIVGYNGTYVGAGVGGSITGMGFDYGIIDDPIKNRHEANSVTLRKNLWEWFTSTFYTRQEKDAKILIMMTRWHESDLVGHLRFLMENDPEAEKWEVLSFPTIAEVDDEYRMAGEVLWPNKYDLQSVMETKRILGTYEFNALHQQRPSPSEGGILNRKWWKYYREAPPRFDAVIQSWDMAFKDSNSSDYVVGGVWGKIGPDRYLLDLIRERMTFTETLQAVRGLSNKWPEAKAKIVEDKANGTAVIDVLKREIPGMIAFNPRGSKVERANAASPAVESGNVYLPINRLWTQDFVDECAAFPNGANDDQVDMFSQAMLRFDKHKKIKTLSKRDFRL